jgi:SAM-dependent methyltransferase
MNVGQEFKLEAGQSMGSACPACGSTKSAPFVQSRDWFFIRQPLYQVNRCEDCHLGWLENPPAMDEMGDHYGADYDKVITTPGDIYPHHWDLVRNKLLQYVHQGSILDIGCSSGSFLRTLKGPDWKLYGIEMSAPVAEQARRSAGAEVFVGDVMQASYAPNEFDAVTGFHVFEHMHDPCEVMTRVFSWLKPGGIFTVTLPNFDSLEARMFGRYWFGLDVPRHLWQFTPRALYAMASFVGFEKIEMLTCSCYLESSVENLIADLKLRGGVPVSFRSDRGNPGFSSRILRKAVRLCVIAPFRRLSITFGAGSDLHCVFRKPNCNGSAGR